MPGPTIATELSAGHAGDELPVIGEPFVVEFVNTMYDRPARSTDYLSDRWMTAWFDQAETGSHRLPPGVPESDRDTIRSIRDAVRTVLAETVEGRQPPAAAVDVLNAAAARVPWQVHLTWSPDADPVIGTTPIASGADAMTAWLARECMVFIASPSLGLVRRCGDPDCPMFFVKQHHKRLFCTEGCAHRARQSRYYRASRTAPLARGAR